MCLLQEDCEINSASTENYLPRLLNYSKLSFYLSADLDKLLGAMGEIVEASVLVDSDHIFDTATVLALKIYTGLDCNNVAGCEAGILGSLGGERGAFVNEHTNAVSEAVSECGAVACVAYDRARDLVSLTAEHSALNSLKRRFLRGKNCVILPADERKTVSDTAVSDR